MFWLGALTATVILIGIVVYAYKTVKKFMEKLQ